VRSLLRRLAPNGAAAHVHASVGQRRPYRLEGVALVTEAKDLGGERSGLARDPAWWIGRDQLHVIDIAAAESPEPGSGCSA
jgi:hypothetical protein